MEGRLQFKDIVDLAKWQKIQDYFAQVLGITLRTVDKDGQFLTQKSGSTRFCDEILKLATEGSKKCVDHLLRALEESDRGWKDGAVCSYVDLHLFAVPLRVGNKTFAYIIVGPVLLGAKISKERYEKLVHNLGIDVQALWDAVLEVKAFTFNGIRSAVELLYDIGRYICELGYQNIRLEKIIPEAPRLILRVYDFYLEKLLEGLLEVSCKYTDAERGSVMLIDEAKNELYIKVAKGLRKNVVENGRSRLNEGIAGIVAYENKPFFIDGNIEHEGIRQQLRNPNIRYAISMPINRDDKVLGVLNLATSQESDKFTSQSMETIDSLTGLVEKTLANIPQSTST